MAKQENTLADRALDAKVAEAVMGWKDVHRVQVGKDRGEYVGKKPDKLGRFRKASLPEFCKDPGIAAEIEARMKELGLWKRYEKELAKATHAKGLPSDWAPPEEACRAALKLVAGSKLRAVK